MDRIKARLRAPGANPEQLVLEIAGPDPTPAKRLAAAKQVQDAVTEIQLDILRNKMMDKQAQITRLEQMGAVPMQVQSLYNEIDKLQSQINALTRNPALEVGGPLPGSEVVVGRVPGLQPTAQRFRAGPTTPAFGRTVGTVKKRNVNLDGGRMRRTLRKKRLTSRRGNKTNGK
jgi:hypothetical protein